MPFTIMLLLSCARTWNRFRCACLLSVASLVTKKSFFPWAANRKRSVSVVRSCTASPGYAMKACPQQHRYFRTWYLRRSRSSAAPGTSSLPVHSVPSCKCVRRSWVSSTHPVDPTMQSYNHHVGLALYCTFGTTVKGLYPCKTNAQSTPC